jgi:hypothetical protein
MDQMAINYTNIFHCKVLQNLPKLRFLARKHTIWQPQSRNFSLKLKIWIWNLSRRPDRHVGLLNEGMNVNHRNLKYRSLHEGKNNKGGGQGVRDPLNINWFSRPDFSCHSFHKVLWRSYRGPISPNLCLLSKAQFYLFLDLDFYDVNSQRLKLKPRSLTFESNY